jgi:8-oxo-dGTP pyrophosphatase MutT (NUDIX family)
MKPLKRTVQVFLTHQWDVLLIFHRGHDKWMGPGGHIEKNELCHEAAVREMMEETGLQISLETKNIDARATFIQPPFSVCRYDSAKKVEEDYCYWLEVDSNMRYQPTISSEDIESLWLPIPIALETLNMYKSTRVKLDNIRYQKEMAAARIKDTDSFMFFVDKDLQRMVE